MHTYSQVALEIQVPPSAENLPISDGGGITFPPASSTAVDTKNPAKKQTRQWDAWTRQEEENFFNALRQVGKNFEKITCRVQSKNKNQVRHYYYRLVRRMNKLLGPGLILDAKNPKDTNAAMLRWWSLLEKYNWSASKLHLKPRRFKIFIEALANQLLKDRNKTKRRRPSQVEPYLVTPPTTSVPSTMPDVNFSKGELSTMKTVRPKRKAGLVASAAYKRWEKAAMAGVSLVADAAEQLERSTIDGNNCFDPESFLVLSNEMYRIDGQREGDSIKNTGYHSPSMTTGICSHQSRETAIQTPAKLKLQLFPVDECTRKALEKDAHNPHLELTLSARKRISSVLEHLNRKWGNSRVAAGELVLFPYSIEHEDITSQNHRWTMRDMVSSAADVYAIVGSPAIFRLRYGWLLTEESDRRIVETPSGAHHFDGDWHSEKICEGYTMDIPNAKTINIDAPSHQPISHISEKTIMPSMYQSNSSEPPLCSTTGASEPILGDQLMESKDELPESCGKSPSCWPGENAIDRCGREEPEDEVELGTRNCGMLSAGEWADSLTNFSVGDLLCEASKAAHSSCVSSSNVGSACCPQQISTSCDSFDAAVAAHISGHQLPNLATQVPLSTMWNAEDACDGFSFQTAPACKRNGSEPSCRKSAGACKQDSRTNLLGFEGFLKDLTKSEPSLEFPGEDLETGPESAKDSSYNGKYDSAGDICLTEISWPDSLGPLDLDVPSSRYHGQDLIFGESMSLSGLGRIIASSVDAFQNCTFFSIDKKDSSMSEAQGASILLDGKTDGG